jgi:myo-inositol 2-dehydrogenase/D-chiro-inositol 1-dehydrogenase
MLTTFKQDALAEPVHAGLIGVGRIGTAHAETLARGVPGAHLMVFADPRPGAAETVANPLGARGVTDPEEIFSDPEIEAVVIAASSTSHTSLILAAIAAGKAVFCEKPMAETLEDIHDFDALNWLNPGAKAVKVYATADALVAPEFKGTGWTRS